MHSRRFSQWMHHAYPRECPYPHMSCTTSQHKPEEWSVSGNELDAVASKEEIKQLTSESSSSSAKVEVAEDVHNLMMWSQLLVVRPPSSRVSNMCNYWFHCDKARSVVYFAAMSSIHGPPHMLRVCGKRSKQNAQHKTRASRAGSVWSSHPSLLQLIPEPTRNLMTLSNRL